MNILVLNGSPHPNGNTKQMINAFCEGARSTGHQLTVIDVCKKDIHGCIACEYCHTKGHGECIQKDDMQEIYDLLKKAEMLVLASPIYYHNISGQLKCVIDRFYSAAYPIKPPHLKKVAMILSSGDANMYDGAMFSYQGDFLSYLGLEDMGVFTAHGGENTSASKLAELRAFGGALKRSANGFSCLFCLCVYSVCWQPPPACQSQTQRHPPDRQMRSSLSRQARLFFPMWKEKQLWTRSSSRSMDRLIPRHWRINPSAEAFAELLKNGPLTVSTHDYGNFEKVGSLGTELPRTDEQITTSPGDIGVVLVVFSSCSFLYISAEKSTNTYLRTWERML